MHLTLRGRVALVTGAGSGIGRHLALELARHGACVAALDLHTGPLESLAAELKAQDHAVAWQVADVADPEALHRAVEALAGLLGPVELLVASAGIGFEMSALDFCAGDIARQVRVNLLGVANCIEAVLPSMLAHGSGHLVVVSSAAACRGLPLMAGYCASKAGVNALVDSLRVELEPRGVCCTLVSPGGVRTPLAEQTFARLGHARAPRWGMIEAGDAARRIVRAIVKRRARYTFPWYWWCVAAGLRWMPSRTGDRLLRWLLRWLRR